MAGLEPASPAVVDSELEACLCDSRDQGLLGTMSIPTQVSHARGMAVAVTTPPGSVLDLGSGGGVPGLVLARGAWHGARWVLLDSSTRRTDFLEASIARLSLDDRVTVVRARAEVAGRRAELRHGFEVVLARSFGPPGVTAECAAPFVQPGGLVVVSEPPGPAVPERWPSAGLQTLNLVIERRVNSPVHLIVLRSMAACDPRYPRRTGVPTKRPLF